MTLSRIRIAFASTKTTCRRSVPGLVGIALCLAVCSCSKEKSFSERTSELEKSVVRVLSVPPDGSGYRSGSAVVINKSGQVLTNWHVLDEMPENWTTYVLRSGEEKIEVYKTKLKAKDRVRDLAVLEADGLKAQPLSVSSNPPPKGGNVRTAGFPGLADDERDVFKLVERLVKTGDDDIESPGEMGNVVSVHFTSGSLSDVKVEPWGMAGSTGKAKVISHDAEISPGSSGGPLLNDGGEIIGINTAGKTSAKDEGSGKILKASHSSEVLAFLKGNEIDHRLDTDREGGSVLLYTAILGGLAFGLWLAYRWRFRLRKIVSEHHLRPRKKRGGQPGPVMPSAPSGSPVPSPSPAGKLYSSESSNTLLTYRSPSRGGAKGDAANPPRVWTFAGQDDSGRSFSFSLNESEFHGGAKAVYLGRKREEVDVHIASESVGRKHAKLLMAGGQLVVQDCGSVNGTVLNGKLLVEGEQSPALSPGDRLELGLLCLTVGQTTEA